MIQRKAERLFQYSLVCTIGMEALAVAGNHFHWNPDLVGGFAGIGAVTGLLGTLNYVSTRNGDPVDPMF